LVEEKIGTFTMYQDWLKNIFAAPEDLRKRLGNLANGTFVAQWVPAVDAKGAQNSFFKINQAPTPIDPTEKRILKARESAVAIATRAINRGGTGHKYWRGFAAPEVRAQIEELGKEIHRALYLPPLGGLPIKSSDVPVAGRGYSSFPFIFDLVNLTGRRVKDSTVTEEVKESFGKDIDGAQTIQLLRSVKKVVSRITTSDPGSLGLHPLVYFYTRGR
jgi:hypothetical protein